MQAFVRKNRFFKEEKWCLLPPCTESGMKEIKCQLCVKDVFIYRTVSWAPIPYKNLRYRLDTMTYSTLQINIKQLHALYCTTISPQNGTILSWADQVKRSILWPNVGKNSFSKPPLKFKTANSCYPYLVLSSRKHNQILSYIEIMQIFSASWSKRIQLSGCHTALHFVTPISD